MKFFIQYKGNGKVYDTNTNPFELFLAFKGLFLRRKKKIVFDFSPNICVENDFYCRWP